MKNEQESWVADALLNSLHPEIDTAHKVLKCCGQEGSTSFRILNRWCKVIAAEEAPALPSLP
jgi:hypothetical protein